MSRHKVYARWLKRPIDLVVGVVGVLLTAPLHACCAVAVWVTSGRPIYYSQVRAGQFGVEFRLTKFRTMQVGTHERSGGYPSEDMITPVGRLLRKSSLDELPQLLNLVRGEMSLVGPRPALPDQVARYSERQMERLSVRPGITGLAQVRFRNAATWSTRIESDIEYIESLSFLRDLGILLRTVPAVAFGIGVSAGQSAADVDDLGPRMDSADE